MTITLRSFTPAAVALVAALGLSACSTLTEQDRAALNRAGADAAEAKAQATAAAQAASEAARAAQDAAAAARAATEAREASERMNADDMRKR